MLGGGKKDGGGQASVVEAKMLLGLGALCLAGLWRRGELQCKGSKERSSRHDANDHGDISFVWVWPRQVRAPREQHGVDGGKALGHALTKARVLVPRTHKGRRESVCVSVCLFLCVRACIQLCLPLRVKASLGTDRACCQEVVAAHLQQRCD